MDVVVVVWVDVDVVDVEVSFFLFLFFFLFFFSAVWWVFGGWLGGGFCGDCRYCGGRWCCE